MSHIVLYSARTAVPIHHAHCTLPLSPFSFLGSEKYPGENEYKRFLSNHGGHSNASTSMQCTNYKNEVLAEHAETTLDMFCNFFIAPLFTLSGTAREVQAIDSENSKNLTADARRRLQILKELCDPDHWYSKFSTGNSLTLDTTTDAQRLEWVREALLAFHRKHYHPSNMTVVIAGPQSLDTLQEWIVARYSKIPIPQEKSPEDKTEMERLIDEAAAEAPPNSLDQPSPPFRSAFVPAQQGGTWPVLLTTKPLKSMRRLVLMWPIPSNDKRVPDQSASSVLSHLLGHEGAGSAFAVLQNHGMLSSLSAGPRTSAPDFTLFQVDMGLTEKGEQHWKEVVDLVFAYCRLLQEQVDVASKSSSSNDKSDMVRIWGEMSRLDEMFFHQTSPGGVYAYAPNLADRVLSYGPEKALSAGSMLEENEDTFPLENVAETVKLLCPSNCIVERCSEAAWEKAMAAEKEAPSKDGFGTKKEKWYGVEYHLSQIDQDVVTSWEGAKLMENEMQASELSLPRPNQYIPRNLELCPELPDEAKHGPRLDKSIDPPQLLIEDSMGRLFHRLDDRYALPKSSLTLLIRNAAVQNVKTEVHWEYNDEASLLSSILTGAFSEAMAQETYDADLAGLRWSLSLGSSGIRLSFFGFSDRLPELGLTILGTFFESVSF
jgi:insulysin